jgi:hypothetical protein
MEIPENIRNSALAASTTTEPNPKLSKILNELGKLDVAVFFNKKSVKLKNRLKNVQELYLALAYEKESEKTGLLASYYRALQSSFVAAFKENDMSKLFAFLACNGLFSLSARTLLATTLISDGEKAALINKICKFIQVYKPQLSVPAHASYHEKQLLTKANNAKPEKNLANFYDLVIGMERSGNPILRSYIVRDLTQLLCELSPEQLSAQLESLSDPFAIVYYLDGLTPEQLTSLSTNQINNEWLSFEIIRKLEQYCRQGMIPGLTEGIELQLGYIFAINPNFFKQAIQFFEGSESVMAAFGKLGSALPTVFIEDIFTNDFELDRYHNRLRAHGAFLNNLEKSANPDKLRSILSSIFRRWKLFNDSLQQDEDYYQFDVLLTNYANYVTAYYSLVLTDTEIVEQMSAIVENIRYIDSEWFSSLSKQITKFHWYGSMVYLLSVAYRQRRIKDAAMFSSLEELTANSIQMKRFQHGNEVMGIDKAWGTVR